MFTINVNQIKMFIGALVALIMLASCQKEDGINSAASIVENDISQGSQSSDIFVFNSESDFQAFKKAFIALRNPYLWKNVQNPNVTTVWDYYVEAETEAEALSSQEEADAFRAKWENKIRFLSDGSMEPLYDFTYKNALAGPNGIFMVGNEFRKVFNNGIAISESRKRLERISGLNYDLTQEIDGVKFAGVTLFGDEEQTNQRATTLSTCTKSRTISGKEYRVQGKMNAGLHDAYGDLTYFTTYFQIVTKMQKKSWGIWVNTDASEIWGSGQLNFSINGTNVSSPYVSDYRTNSKVLFVSDEPGPFAGDHHDADVDSGWGGHHTKISSNGFDESCNTSN